MNIEPTKQNNKLTLNQERHHWISYIEDFINYYDAQLYELTFMFDKYSGFNFVTPDSSRVERNHFTKNIVVKTPDSTVLANYRHAIGVWYLKMLEEVFSKQFHKHRDYQPFGIGYVDKPVMKSEKDGAVHLKPNVEYPHAHVLLAVPKRRDGDGFTIEINDRFEGLQDFGGLHAIWEKMTPGGRFHIEPCNTTHEDIERILRYNSKTATKMIEGRDSEILLPVGGTYSLDFRRDSHGGF